jgi:acyl-coenzyme A synthetase/AMP-(fatty) acid ligase
MNTPLHALPSIRHTLASAPESQQRFVWGATASVRLGHLPAGACLGDRVDELAGRSVLVAARDQIAAALAFIALDGIARRLVVCTPDLAAEHLPAVVASAGVDAILSGHSTELRIQKSESESQTSPEEFHLRNSPFQTPTEWVLLTSGTTGAPKMLVHTFASLTAPIGGALAQGDDIVWGTFYDIRRYGGLQIFFRTILGRGSLVLSDAGESIGDHLGRLSAHGVTHVSGTPSHWRRVLMSPEARTISPRYIRLSGEIADQGILNALHACYPQASIGHAFASTEAGVGFEVDDGLEGFPASLVGAPGHVQIKVEDGSLRIRSARNALRYIGEAQSAVTGDDDFVDTGDMVERRGDRYYFLGRRSGIINVGGLKVYPEEVEAAINRHPAVRMSMVRSSRSPITGSLVAADVVLMQETGAGDGVEFKREILQICHDRLAPYKVPATIRFVSALGIAAAGKLARHA